MGRQSPGLILLLLVSLGASAPGAQHTQSVSDAAVLAELQAQRVEMQAQTQVLRQLVTAQANLQTRLDSLTTMVTNQRADLNSWRISSIFLLESCGLCLGIFWGMATWYMVLKSMRDDSLL